MGWWPLLFLHYVSENFSKLDIDSLIQVSQNYNWCIIQGRKRQTKRQRDEEITDKIIIFILSMSYNYFVMLTSQVPTLVIINFIKVANKIIQTDKTNEKLKY